MRCVRVKSGRTFENPAFPDRTEPDRQHDGRRKALSVSVRSRVLATADRYTAVRRIIETAGRTEPPATD